MEIERIDPSQARVDVAAGKALLVCAYDSPEKFQQNHLDGALSLQDLQKLEDQIPRDREIVFYCA
jgi:rhodanese-related sulfurtransferase